jgi:hypothetical protein
VLSFLAFFIGSLEVFFLQKALEPLVRIKPGFQRWEPIACGVSRGTPGEHGVFAPRVAPQAQAREPGSKKASEASPPPKFINPIGELCVALFY